MTQASCFNFQYDPHHSQLSISADLEWDEAVGIIQNLIDKRNQTAHPVEPPTDKLEFRDALRFLRQLNDIDEEDEGIAYNVYTLCKRKCRGGFKL